MKNTNDIANEFDTDYKRWFENCKRTFTGVNAGSYIDEDDFMIYGRNTANNYQSLKESNAELIKNLTAILERIEEHNFHNKHFPGAYERAIEALNKAKNI